MFKKRSMEKSEGSEYPKHFIRIRSWIPLLIIDFEVIRVHFRGNGYRIQANSPRFRATMLRKPYFAYLLPATVAVPWVAFEFKRPLLSYLPSTRRVRARVSMSHYRDGREKIGRKREPGRKREKKREKRVRVQGGMRETSTIRDRFLSSLPCVVGLPLPRETCLLASSCVIFPAKETTCEPVGV